MIYCNKCGKEIKNSGHVCNSEHYDSGHMPNVTTKAAIKEARSMTHDAVLAEVRAELDKLNSMDRLSDYAMGYRDALQKLSEHFS